MSITSTLSSLSTKLRKASYNGVNFEVSNSNLKFGRRVVVHEYPQQDVPYGEDLGKATRIITMSAFIVGADYASRSKKLIEALEKPVTEPGTLVHPWLGSLKVYLSEKPQITWNLAQRLVTFNLTFVEAGQLNKPKSGTSWGDKLRAKVDSFMNEALGNFDINMSNIDNLTNNIADVIDGSVSDVLGCLSDSPISSMFDLGDTISDLANNAGSLLSQSPLDFGKEFISALGLGSYCNSVRNWRDCSKGLTDVVNSPKLTYTKSDSSTDKANKAITTFSRQVMLANALGSASLIASSIDSDTDDEQEVTTRSDDEIRQIRNDLLNAIEQEMINAENDDNNLYESLEELYIDTYQTLTSEILQDSELVDVKLPTTTPLLVVAYDKYENSKRADEIARRNNVVNPCFASDSLILQRTQYE